MKNYINYILEKKLEYLQNLELDECMKLFKTLPLYDKMMTTDITKLTLIYRQVIYNNQFGNKYTDMNIVDPKTIKRISPNASSNLYNLFFSNSERWCEYPKRNKSLICGDSVAVNRRLTYKRSQMVVIPLESVKIGVCSDNDIWSSFNTISDFVDDFFYSLKENYFYLSRNNFTDNNWSKFKKELIEYDKLRSGVNEILSNPSPHFSVNDNGPEKMILSKKIMMKWKNNEISTLELLNMLFDPDKNNFKILDYDGTNLPSNREVWTDSKSLLIEKDYFFTLLIGMQKEYKENIESFKPKK